MRQEITQEFKNAMQDYLRDIHTVMPGKIIAFDPDKCEAQISPTAKYRKPDDTQIDFPDIFEVPVFFMQAIGQRATITHAVKPDDECLIFISEQALDLWRTGAESPTDLRFDITNAIAVIGFFAQPNPLIKRACENESIIIQRANNFIELFENKTEIVVEGTEIVIEPEKITMNTVDVVINADGNIDMIAGGDINITAAGNITDSATRIDHN